MDINISVKNKIAAAEETAVVCGNSDYVVRFDLDGEWAEYKTKTMRVDMMNGAYQDVMFEGNSCPMPVIRDRTMVAVGIYAGEIHTTTPAILRCEKCITDSDGVAESPAPDVYSQLLRRLDDFDGYWMPSVDGNGDLSWEREKDDGAPETVNIKGEKGDPGEKGDKGETGDRGIPGAAATVTVGTVTTGAAGSQASVTNSGTENDAVLNFTIPKGDKGDNGSPNDYVVQHGTTGIWTWRKWNSGAAECWGIYTGNITDGTSKNYEGYYYTNEIMVDFPFTFAEKPAVSFDGGSFDHINFARGFGTGASQAGFIIMSVTKADTLKNVQVSILARGRWK